MYSGDVRSGVVRIGFAVMRTVNGSPIARRVYALSLGACKRGAESSDSNEANADY